MDYTVFDIEADGLLDQVSKIYILSYSIYKDGKFIKKDSLYTYKDMKKFIKDNEILVGHNIIEYDVPVLEKILGIKIENTLIDTIAISYSLNHMKGFKHGLEAYGDRFKIKKIEVKDWINISKELYKKRCETDVEINVKLFHIQLDFYKRLYDNEKEILNFFNYLGFIKKCLKRQYEAKIKLNVDLSIKHKTTLEKLFNEKYKALTEAMPKKLGKIIKTQPKKLYKIDGNLSKKGLEWYEYLKNNNLDISTKIIREEPNPGSHAQLKKWLHELGWIPETFKENDKGEKIPQVSLPFGQGLCPSVKNMFLEYPFLENLDSLYKIRHRLSLFKGYLSTKDENDMVVSQALGLTNTLRLKHLKPIANLPKVGTFFGKEVREVLTVYDDTYLMCGADISGLESATADHYMYPYDKEYVEKRRTPGYDPHTTFAIFANKMTKEEEIFYKKCEESEIFKKENIKDYKKIKKIRGSLKQVNFSGIYGAGPLKISKVLKISFAEAKKLHKAYWDLNWSVKAVAENTIIKEIDSKLFLYNPVNGFWYFLKYRKDIFSTLNQGTGAYVFNVWLYNIYLLLDKYNLNDYIKIVLQYHDETLLIFKKHLKEKVNSILYEAMEMTNKELQLNVKIEMKPEYGLNYAEVH